jgi:hypothetical protein
MVWSVPIFIRSIIAVVHPAASALIMTTMSTHVARPAIMKIRLKSMTLRWPSVRHHAAQTIIRRLCFPAAALIMIPKINIRLSGHSVLA